MHEDPPSLKIDRRAHGLKKRHLSNIDQARGCRHRNGGFARKRREPCTRLIVSLRRGGRAGFMAFVGSFHPGDQRVGELLVPAVPPRSRVRVFAFGQTAL